jgi:hypothetical protein
LRAREPSASAKTGAKRRFKHSDAGGGFLQVTVYPETSSIPLEPASSQWLQQIAVSAQKFPFG